MSGFKITKGGWMATVPPRYLEYLIYVDPERCVGCRSCEIACAVEHSSSKELFQAVFEDPTPRPRTKVVPAAGVYVPMRCMHCDPAPCVEACPTGAMQRTEEGFVISDLEKCIGCRTCLLACPFGHPAYDFRRKVVKCDHCVDRFRAGLPPACVEACPTGALRYGRAEDILDREKIRRAADMVLGLAEAAVVYARPAEKAPKSPLASLREMYETVRWSE